MNAPTLTLLALLGLAITTTPWGPPQERGGRGRGERPPAEQGGRRQKPPERGEEEQDPADGKARAGEQAQMASNYFKVADYDGDGWISYREAKISLELNRQRFSTFDADRDGRITLEEFTKIFRNTIKKVGAFKPPIPDPTDPDAISLEELLIEGEEPEEVVEAVKVESVLELFGEVVPREEQEHGAAQPDRIVGPVPSFRRIDYDNDGGISHADLTELLKGAGLEVRINTLLASLDEDGNGKIDEAEFFASMRSRKKSY